MPVYGPNDLMPSRTMDLSLLSVPRPKPQKPTCSKCGSDQVVADASATWNADLQAWQVNDLYDKGGWCQACDDTDIRFNWVDTEA